MNFADELAASVMAAYAAVPRPPLIVAICGWADTGKSTLAAGLCASLGRQGLGADWISTDAFLRSRSERNAIGITGYDSLAIDDQAMQDAVAAMARRQALVHFPYDNRTGARASTARTLAPQPVIVIEGIHALHPSISQAIGLRVFIDADEDTLRAMRIRANLSKRGMDVAQAQARVDHELDDFRAFILPLKQRADISARVSLDFEYTIAPGRIGEA